MMAEPPQRAASAAVGRATVQWAAPPGSSAKFRTDRDRISSAQPSARSWPFVVAAPAFLSAAVPRPFRWALAARVSARAALALVVQSAWAPVVWVARAPLAAPRPRAVEPVSGPAVHAPAWSPAHLRSAPPAWHPAAVCSGWAALLGFPEQSSPAPPP